MRVTAETKVATRERILEVARGLFAENGFEATTTREIAQAAEIATGTLFNYFATKEAIVACLAAEAAAGAHQEFERKALDAESFEEELFAFVAERLRKFKPLRKHLPALLETTLHRLVTAPGDDSQSLRVNHLETVSQLAHKHGFGVLSPVALQLYWTLYSGVLVFWANDKSPKQEDTLAVLDHSVEMFVGWLNGQRDASPSKSRKK
jgi:AcrR family transcriptional regulator